jgi:hypothetical protein
MQGELATTPQSTSVRSRCTAVPPSMSSCMSDAQRGLLCMSTRLFLGLGCSTGLSADPRTFSARVPGMRWLAWTDSSKRPLCPPTLHQEKGSKHETLATCARRCLEPGALAESFASRSSTGAAQDVIPCRRRLCAGYPANLTSQLPSNGGGAPGQHCADRDCDQRRAHQCEARLAKGAAKTRVTSSLST